MSTPLPIYIHELYNDNNLQVHKRQLQSLPISWAPNGGALRRSSNHKGCAFTDQGCDVYTSYSSATSGRARGQHRAAGAGLEEYFVWNQSTGPIKLQTDHGRILVVRPRANVKILSLLRIVVPWPLSGQILLPVWSSPIVHLAFSYLQLQNLKVSEDQSV